MSLIINKKNKILPISYFLVLALLISSLNISGNLINQGKNHLINPTESEYKATGFFYCKKINDVWWLIDPNGEKFYSIGISYVQPGDFYYGHISDWVNYTKERLENWGFNTLIGGNTNLFPDFPYIYKFKFKHIVVEEGWSNRRIPDVFDIGWQNEVKRIINETTASLISDSNLIGYQTDNEMKWSPDTLDTDTVLEVFFSANKTTAGKKSIVEFLKERYDNKPDDFNEIWNMDINNFEELYNYKKLGREGWKVRTGKAFEDINDFNRLVARKYFNFTNSVLKSADPNHLNLGVRFYLIGVPREVLEECGNNVDVISINYYRKHPLYYDLTSYLNSKIYNCVTLDNWMYNYHYITGKPLLVSEFSYEKQDDIWPIIPKPEMFKRNIISPKKNGLTDNNRVNFFEGYARNCLKRSYMIGHIWFSYQDRLDIRKGGLVNIWDEPYSSLVEKMSEINKESIELHENSTISLITQTSFNIYKNIIQYIFQKESTIKNSYYKKEMDYIKNEEIFDNIISNYSRVNNNYTDKIFYVGGSGDKNFSSIQDAIDNASSGDTVFVYNGTYKENIHINKKINLIGAGINNTKIIGIYNESNDENIIIKITEDSVNVSGFTITNDDGYFHDYFYRTCSGISIDYADNCSIYKNYLTDLGDFGIRVRKGNDCSIKNNRIDNVLNKIGCNILIDSSNNSRIINNILTRSTISGIWISRCNNAIINKNYILNSYYCGIILERSTYINISYNTLIENNHTGLYLRDSDNNIISSNNFIKYDTLKIDNFNILYFINKFDCRLAFFYNSNENIWEGNYWHQSRILPKIIFGKTGKNNLLITFNIDLTPAEKMIDIDN